MIWSEMIIPASVPAVMPACGKGVLRAASTPLAKVRVKLLPCAQQADQYDPLLLSQGMAEVPGAAQRSASTHATAARHAWAAGHRSRSPWRESPVAT